MSAKKPDTSTKGRKPRKRATPKKVGLTDKQKIFCREYTLDLNATQAAIRAGYSKKTARQAGCENLSKPNIQEELSKLMQKREEKLEVSAENVVRELMNLAFSDIGEIFNDDGSLKSLSEIPKNVRKAIAGIDVFEEFEGRGKDRELIGFTKKVRLWDKTKALEMLGKHLKMFTDKMELTGRNGEPLVQKSMSPEAEKEIKDCMAEVRATLKIPEGLKPLDS